MATTPYRSTRVEMDYTDYCVVSDAWGGSRTAQQIADAVSIGNGYDNQYAKGVRYWPGSSTWTLQPLQEVMSRFHEKIPPGLTREDLLYRTGVAVEQASQPGSRPMNMMLAVLDSATTLAAERMTRPKLPGLLGFEVGQSILDGMVDRGDPVYQRRVEAGKTWAVNQGLPVPLMPAPQNSFSGTPSLTAGLLSTGLKPANVILDPIVYSMQSQRADQGFFLRWSVPGTSHSTPDYVLNFYFGQFCVVVCGDGRMRLMEWARPRNSGTPRWALRHTWQYCLPGESVGVMHTLLIYPQIGPWGDKYIHFVNNRLSSAGVYGPSAATSEITWKSDPITREFDQEEATAKHVTKEGRIRLDHRRDIRVSWQVTRLMFVSEGILADAAFPKRPALMGGQSAKIEVRVKKRFPDLPDGYFGGSFDVKATIADAVTRQTYDPNGSGYGNAVIPYAVFRFTGASDPKLLGACDDTPILDEYWMYQPPVARNQSPGMFTAPGILECSIEGGDREPQNERAVVTVPDNNNYLPRLRRRGEVPCRVVTAFYPPGESVPVDVVLFQGYAIRPQQRRIGRYNQQGLQVGILLPENAGGFGQGVPAHVPSPYQSEFFLTLTGMWRKLSSDVRNLRQSVIWRRYAEDSTAEKDPVTGAYPPWKATDVLRDILKVSGFPDSMIAIPDSPIRMFPGMGTLPADLELTIETDFLQVLVRIATMYLGATIAFDPNRGMTGQWILIQNAGMPGQSPVFHFVTYAQTNHLPTELPQGYAENTGFVTGPLEAYNVPPEYNRIMVTTAGPGLFTGTDKKTGVITSEIINYDSYAPPDAYYLPDPANAHYLGYEKTYFHIDPTLMGIGENKYENGQAACDYVARRLYDLIGKARRILPINAPLYFIQDAESMRWRPLRYGDAVTFDGDADWFVLNVNPQFNLDSHQTAMYELVKVIPNTYGN